MSRLWIQDPLAIFAQDATRGVVIEGRQITELIATGQEPLQPVDAIFGKLMEFGISKLH